MTKTERKIAERRRLAGSPYYMTSSEIRQLMDYRSRRRKANARAREQRRVNRRRA